MWFPVLLRLLEMNVRLFTITNFQRYNHRQAYGHMDVGTCPQQVLTANLTLSQPRGGGQIKPTLYWCPHQVLKATGAPELISTKDLQTFW